MITLEVQKEYKRIEPELQYVIDVYNDTYQLTEDVTVGYGDVSGAEIEIKPGGSYQFILGKNPLPEQFGLTEWNGYQLPVIGNPLADKIIKQNGIYEITADILLSAFYFLSGWQEAFSTQRDHLGRFPAGESFLVKNNYIQKPIVNYYFDVLNHTIGELSANIPIATINKDSNQKISAILSHDIDQCNTGWKQDAYRALRDGHIATAVKAPLQRIFGKDIWFNFDQIKKLEAEKNVSSVFYFINEKKKYGKHPNADYDIHSPEILKELHLLEEAGCEIGAHFSLGTAWDRNQIERELETFPVKVQGGRFHYLAFSNPRSFRILEAAGVLYDSSLGFAEVPGFRNGFCFPFHPYDYENRKAFSLIELPLVIMDWTFIGKEYLHMQPDEIYPQLEDIIAEVDKFSGLLVILWHNNSFSGYKFRGWDEPYLWLIDHLHSLNCRFILPSDLL